MEQPPKKIKILYQTWTVKFAPCRYCDAADAWGWADKERQRIYLDGRATPQQMREYLLHEIQHVVNFLMQLKGADDEALAKRGAIAWMTIFSDNPKLRKWLFKRMKK